jgi:hypothetical protein
MGPTYYRLQSKRRPPIGSSIGATEGEGDKAPLVFPLKKKNKRLQAKRIMLELAAHGFINTSPEPEPESDEAPLVFPLEKKNKRMQAKDIMLELAAHGLLGIPPEPAVADADVDSQVHVCCCRRVSTAFGVLGHTYRSLRSTRHNHYRCLLPCNGI